MLRVLSAAIGVIAVCAGPAVAGQEPEAVGLALVTVVDSANQPTVNLDAADFIVTQGSEERDIFDVRIADYPLVLLLDNGADSSADLTTIRAAAARFVERVGDRPLAVLTLTEPPAVLASFEDGRAAALAEIEGLSAADTALRAPLHALGAASQMVLETGVPFAAIVLVSAAPLEEGQVEPPGFLTSFIESRSILYVVTKGAAAVPGGTRSEDILRSMADRSGGRHLLIYSAASFEIVLAQIADRLGTEMLIEYLVPAGAAPGQDIRVGVKVPGARVRGLGVSH